ESVGYDFTDGDHGNVVGGFRIGAITAGDFTEQAGVPDKVTGLLYQLRHRAPKILGLQRRGPRLATELGTLDDRMRDDVRRVLPEKQNSRVGQAPVTKQVCVLKELRRVRLVRNLRRDVRPHPGSKISQALPAERAYPGDSI